MTLLKLYLHWCGRILTSVPLPFALVILSCAIAGFALLVAALGTILLIPAALMVVWVALGLVEALMKGTGRAVTTVGSLAPRPKTMGNRVVIEIRLLRLGLGDYRRARRTWLACNWQELPDPNGPLPNPATAFDRLLAEQVPEHRRTASRR